MKWLTERRSTSFRSEFATFPMVWHKSLRINIGNSYPNWTPGVEKQYFPIYKMNNKSPDSARHRSVRARRFLGRLTSLHTSQADHSNVHPKTGQDTAEPLQIDTGKFITTTIQHPCTMYHPCLHQFVKSSGTSVEFMVKGR